jgi:hypothetical protein
MDTLCTVGESGRTSDSKLSLSRRCVTHSRKVPLDAVPSLSEADPVSLQRS